MSRPEVVSLADIVADAVVCRDLDDRERTEDAIESYADSYQRGDELPPLEVFLVDGARVLVNGLHRYQALEAIGREVASVRVVGRGTIDDALRYALTSNLANGMRWSRADCRRRVFLALDSGMWDDLGSERKLAAELRMSHTTVGKYRKEWEAARAPQPSRGAGVDEALPLAGSAVSDLTRVATVDTPDERPEPESSRGVGSVAAESDGPEGTPEPPITDDEALPFEPPDPEPDAVDRLIAQTDEDAAALEAAIRKAQRLARQLAGRDPRNCPLSSTASELATRLRQLASRPGQCRIVRHDDCGGVGCGRCQYRGWILASSVRRAERRTG